MCGVNGEIIRTSASTASFRTAIVPARSTAPTADGVVRVLTDAQAVGAAAERIQLVHQLHQRRDGGVQMDARIEIRVTRRIVSCVFRRSARSASFSSTSHGPGMPSPPIVSHS